MGERLHAQEFSWVSSARDELALSSIRGGDPLSLTELLNDSCAVSLAYNTLLDSTHPGPFLSLPIRSPARPTSYAILCPAKKKKKESALTPPSNHLEGKKKGAPHGPNDLDLGRRQPVPGRAEHLLGLLGTVERQQGRDLLQPREGLAERAGREARLGREVREDGADVAVETQGTELEEAGSAWDEERGRGEELPR